MLFILALLSLICFGFSLLELAKNNSFSNKFWYVFTNRLKQIKHYKVLTLFNKNAYNSKLDVTEIDVYKRQVFYTQSAAVSSGTHCPKF